jgi:hypothetical protein
MIINPVFIIGCPRSGTSLLFTLLRTSSALWSTGDEGRDIWEVHHHPSRRGWESNALGPEDVTEGSRAFIHAAFERDSLPGTIWRLPIILPHGGGRLAFLSRRLRRWLWSTAAPFRRNGSVRLLEKTPDNCLRIPFIQAVFPDASFIYLKRDGRANINSLIEGWKAGRRFEQYRVPVELSIPGHNGGGWRFGLPPGWRDFVSRPLDEVCAYQWVSYNEAVLRVADPLVRTGRLLPVKYEDLTRRPSEALKTITAFLGIPYERHMDRYDRKLPIVSRMTDPEPDKWKRQNSVAIERIVPIIRPTMHRMGYVI